MLAFYRKYRPSTFNDLIGQEITVRILQEAARQDRFSHAYLLSGPRGTGKTTSARLIAKIVNCEKRANDAAFKSKGEPCNTCEACIAIESGSALDVIELDAASNRGIDEIRDLKEHARVSPAVLRRKIFIIDEAHMLTKDAANALLKTLEEPPPHLIIILATTEPEKLPATIISRTQQFNFKKAGLKDIIIKLGKIARDERIAVSEEALELIAASSEGSFRDAEALLDQAAIAGKDEISRGAIEKLLGRAGFQVIARLAENILKNNLSGALEIINEVSESGINLTDFTKDLLIHLRRLALLAHHPGMKSLFSNEMTDENLKETERQAGFFEKRHLAIIKSLIGAYENIRYSQFPIIPLEIAVIEEMGKNAAI